MGGRERQEMGLAERFFLWDSYINRGAMRVGRRKLEAL